MSARPGRLLAILVAALAAFGLDVPAAIADDAAAEVTAVRIGRLEPLAGDGSAPALVTIADRPVVIQRTAAYGLAGDERSWTPLDKRKLGADRAIGGSVTDGRRTFLLLSQPQGVDRVAELSLDGTALALQLLPPLPVALRDAKGAIQGDSLVVAGEAPDGAARLFRFPLTAGDNWKEASVWPGGGSPRTLTGQGLGLFVVLADGRHWRWTVKSGWEPRARVPLPVRTVWARPISQAGLLYLLDDAAGSARLYGYSTITDAWAQLGRREAGGALAKVRYRDGLLGVRADGDRLTFTTAQVEYRRRALGFLDLAIVAVYLVAMLAVGFYFYRGAKRGTSSEFFLGSRSIPFWAAGISMFAGSISSISYLAIPAKAFETNWEYIMSKMTTIVGLIFVAIWIVPLFRRLDLVSVFNYLETRFHPAIRLLSSALWMLMQVGGRMGIVLFLPAMAIGTITDTNIVACIVVVGIFTIIYTALGGMKAVVWTDVFQVLVLAGGAIFAIGFIIAKLGLGSVVDTAQAFDKTDMVNLSFDVTEPTVFGFLILVLFDVVLTFPKDQVLMQRVLATPSEKAASRSVWVFAIVLLPSAFMFYIIGTVLFAYYRAYPERLNPLLPIDAVFPAFIGTELPAGVTGLIIAGLVAAAMGTLSGIINSVATLLSVDFYGKFRNPTQEQTVRFAEWMSVIVGLVGIAIAIVLSRLDIHSLLDLTIELFGLLGGSCAGAYTLGMFTTRANWQGVAIGIVAASLLTLVVWIFGLIHPYWYLALAIMASIVIGYAASFAFPRPAHSLEGLTIFTGGGRKGREEPARSTPAS